MCSGSKVQDFVADFRAADDRIKRSENQLSGRAGDVSALPVSTRPQP